MSITGEPGGPPMKIGVPVTDLGAGFFALTAILAALHHRSRTGRGQHIDVSLVDAGVALSVWEATEYFAGRGVPQPTGSAHRLIAPYQAIRCADGFITLAAANQRLFERLCALLGHDEWITDPDYATDTGRVRHRAALAHLIEGQTIARPCAEWIAIFEEHDIPCGPINTYEQVFADPQVAARHMVVLTEHPTLGSLRTLGSPMKMSGTPPLVGRPAPLLGEHTDEVLREIAAGRPKQE
jgi:formyl-CoA transferase